MPTSSTEPHYYILFLHANSTRNDEEPKKNGPKKAHLLNQGPDQNQMIELVNLFNAAHYEQVLILAKSMISANPQHGFAWKVLGAVLTKLGKNAEALIAKRKSALLSPGDAEAHANLAKTLIDMHAYEEAAASSMRAIEIDPKLARAHNSLAQAYQNMGKLKDAEACCREALAIDPKLAEASNVLGNILNDLGRPLEAESSYKRALAQQPNNVEVLVNLGIALIKSRPKESESCFLKAIEIQPNYVKAYVALGEIHFNMGCFDKASESFQQALKYNPAEPTALAALANICKMTNADMNWLTQAQAAIACELPVKEAVALNFSIGKYFDDTGAYDQAFSYYQHANNLKKSYSPTYDALNDAQADERLMISYNDDLFLRIQHIANASTCPVFVVGMPRSGTSLTEQILASHPDAYGAGELVFWSNFVIENQNAFLNAELTDESIINAATEYLENLLMHSGGSQKVVDKMPGNFRYLGLIHAIFPNAKILHTLRNPIDTCLSIYFQNFNVTHSYSNDLVDIANFYKNYHKIMMHWHKVLPPNILLDVPYEALIEDQEAWSRKIIEFIGLDWNEQCLGFHKTARNVGTASNWQVKQPIYKTSKERWRNYEKYVSPLLPLLELYDPAKTQVKI